MFEMRFRLLLSILFIALTSLTVPSRAQSPKPPWRWTLDERLSAINDPAAAAERLRVAQGRPGWPLAKRAPNANPGPSDQVDFISGRDHPELLLPWELFDHMMKMAYADDPEVRSVFREAKSPALTGSGLALKCRDRATAIAAARLDLGEKFDQFLYVGIAPNMSIAIARLGQISQAREHEIEIGCL